MKRLLVFAVGVLFILSASGCFVAESAYLKKVEENEGLSKELSELQKAHSKLLEENGALKAEVKKLTDDVAAFSADKFQLEGILKAKTDSFFNNIDGLRKQMEDIKRENGRLNGEISEHVRLQEEKVKQIDGLNQQVADMKAENGKLVVEILELQKQKDEKSKEIDVLRKQVDGLKVEGLKLNDEISSLQKIKEEKLKEVSGTYEQLLDNMKNEIAKGQVTISELKGKLTVNMEAAILFDSGKADVKPAGLEILGKMVETLKGVNGKAIRIEGHTDAVHITGALARTYPTNWELSAARAINVAKFLQQQGIDPRNLSAAAFAEHKPVADNSSSDGKAKNRRIEITLIAKD